MTTNPYDVVFPVNEILLETFGEGPPGLTGPVGPQGATGPQGPKGTAGAFVDVKDWGAVGDNATNDTAAIQNAYAAAIAAGVKALYFPAGTYLVQPDIHGVILTVRETDFTFFGAGQSVSTIKVKASAGDYISVISDGVYTGSGFFDMSGFQFHDMGMDGNSANNPISDVSITGPLFNGYPRLGIRSYKGNYGNIYNARFRNFDNINTIAINGGAAITRTWAIHHCLFDNVGAGLAHDHSTIYFHGDNVFISQNTFLGGGDAATTAIETHGPNQLVTTNFVRDFFTLANLTGVSADNSYNVTASHNHGQRLGIGIAIWAYDYGGIVGYALDSLIISENNIEVDYDRWNSLPAFRTGIALYASSTALCRNVKITNNVVRYAPHTDTPVGNDNLSAGIGWFRIVVASEGTEEVDIEICGNTITGSLGAGIQYEPGILSKRVKISGNTITNPGDGCPASLYAVGIRGYVATFGAHDMEVSHNRIIDTRATHLITRGVDLSNTSVLTNGRAIENSVRCDDGTIIQTHTIHASAPWNLSSSVGAFHQRYTALRYYAAAPAQSRTTLAMTQNVLYLGKFIVGVSNTFDRIGANVTVTPGTTSLRIGLFEAATSDNAGILIADYGTVSAATTGFKEINITQALRSGVYWIGLVAQGGTATVTATNMGIHTVGHATPASLVTSDYCGLQTSNTFSGALSSSPVIANYTAFSPLILLRSM